MDAGCIDETAAVCNANEVQYKTDIIIITHFNKLAYCQFVSNEWETDRDRFLAYLKFDQVSIYCYNLL